MKIHKMLVCALLGSAVHAGDMHADVPDDASLHDGLLALQYGAIQEREYTEVERVYYLGIKSERSRVRVWSSKSLGIAKLEIYDMDSGETGRPLIASLIDIKKGVVYLRRGDTVARAPEHEAKEHLLRFQKGMDQRFDSTGWEIYRLGEETIRGVDCIVFVLYDRNKDNEGDWLRVWINPANGFTYRTERYEGPGLTVREFLDVKIDHGLSEEFLRKGFEREDLPIMSMEEIFKSGSEKSR
jgi:hypothetical protein